MDKIKKVAARTKKFAQDHKVAITMVCTAGVCLYINRLALEAHDDFLKEHDLYEKFYTPSDEEDLEVA